MEAASTPAPASCLIRRATAWASAALLDEWLLSCLLCPLHPMHVDGHPPHRDRDLGKV